MTSTPKTVLEVLEAGAGFLERGGIEHPRLACELLLSRLLNCRRLELYLKYDTPLGEKYLEAMRRGLQRVKAGEPVQYVLGQTGFMSHTFKVDRRALIPRPETEALVEHVLQYKPLWEKERPAVVDVGTGSGCIVVSLVKSHPHGRYIALDTDAEALALARENAEGLGVADKIIFADGELPDLVEPETMDAVVANLPYIPTAVCEKLPSHIRDHEPRSALDGGADGLSIIETVVQDAGIVLVTGGALFLEIGDDQGTAVVSMLKETGFTDTEIKQDLNKRDRVVSALLA